MTRSIEKSEPKAAQARKKLNFKMVFTQSDITFLVLILILLVFGLAMLASASYATAINSAKTNFDGLYYIRKQFMATLLGVAAMFGISLVDYHFYQNTFVCYSILVVSYILNIYCMFKGISTAGASRWIQIPFLGQFQPSEIMKVAFIIVFAYIIAVNFTKFKKDWKYCVIPFMVILGITVVILAGQRHMSAVMLVTLVGVIMLIVSGIPAMILAKLFAAAGGVGIVGIIALAATGKFSYITDRLHTWLDPLSDIQNSTLQTYQSLLSIGSGGIFGLGYGNSRQKFAYLPEAQNDFIFSIVCEELGLAGAILVILLFVSLGVRGVHIAVHSKDRFGMLLTTGITAQIVLQALLNIAVACNAFPNTGISLPFFSYGGTSMVILLAEAGIVLNVSRQKVSD